jgi:hypothetical protein
MFEDVDTEVAFEPYPSKYEPGDKMTAWVERED